MTLYTLHSDLLSIMHSNDDEVKIRRLALREALVGCAGKISL